MSDTVAQWLMSEAPTSRRQAIFGNVYRGIRSIVRNPTAFVGLVIVAGLVLMAAFAPWLTMGKSPLDQDLAGRLAPPSEAHWFGSDELGRDIFARTLYGARVTLTIVLLVSVVVVPIGLAVGTVAGYLGGWVDAVLMDVHMPGMDGLEALRRIRAGETGRPVTPVIALTADAMAGVDDELIAQGFDAVEPKPINPGRLVATILAVTAGAEQLAAPIAESGAA